jgi:mRNA-degrading endonuclease YafQ of YafQ-DinJ toxin-antitoxin module
MKKAFDEVRRLAEFKKDLKRLLKKFRTLEDDLQTFIQKQLSLYHKLRIDNKGIFPISDLGTSYPKIFKAKKFACRSLKGKGAKSGIRVIYAYFDQEDVIELIEIYYKGEKENEDRNRILKHYRDRISKKSDQD